jgi:hypothetical protein
MNNNKRKEFNTFKTIAGITFLVVLLLLFMNLLSLENRRINLKF